MANYLLQLRRILIPDYATLRARFERWVKENGKFWAASVGMHLVILLVLGVLIGSVHVAKRLANDEVFLESDIDTALPEPELSHFEIGETPIEQTVLNTESLQMNEAPQLEQTEQINDNSSSFEEAGGGLASATGPSFGGLGNFDVKAIGDGPAVRGPGGVGTGVGTGKNAGSGGGGTGFGGRGSGMRQAMVGGFGGTKQTERAVAGGLNWLARHQNQDGSWSIHDHRSHCKDSTCTGQGTVASNAAGTAFGLLPFFAAGQTHESKGPYQKTIFEGVNWLVKNQTKDGNLTQGSQQPMYSHGLATIALCEAYGLTKDRRIRDAAQGAVNFIQVNQDKGGSWAYNPSPTTSGDTSIVGWQIMGLKSAQMAGLKVDPKTLERAKGFLKSCSSGANHGLYGYLPGAGGSTTMTSVGLLCMQYMGMKREDPEMVEGMGFLMQNLPNPVNRNCYYWYYATQVMHNLPGPEWDTWNRRSRRMLLTTQVKEGCASGSWDPEQPVKDAFGDTGGRLMVTSIATLSLEVYYRYLPLYQIDSKSGLGKGLESVTEGEQKKP